MRRPDAGTRSPHHSGRGAIHRDSIIVHHEPHHPGESEGEHDESREGIDLHRGTGPGAESDKREKCVDGDEDQPVIAFAA
jgi:hypothetical protein